MLAAQAHTAGAQPTVTTTVRAARCKEPPGWKPSEEGTLVQWAQVPWEGANLELLERGMQGDLGRSGWAPGLPVWPVL